MLKLIEILDTDYQQGLISLCILIKIKINQMRKLCDNILCIKVAHDTTKQNEGRKKYLLLIVIERLKIVLII